MEDKSIDSALTKIGIGRFNLTLFFIMSSVLACDSMEILVLTFLGPILSCYWKMSLVESALLTTAVLFGNIIGNLLFGSFSDKYGRKVILLITCMGLSYFGLISSVSPNINWMITMRCIIGIFIGGTGSSMYSLLSELTPMKHRGIQMMFLQIFWSVGSYLIATLCYLILPSLGWRMFLLLSSFPICTIVVSIFWLPESPRFLLLKNEYKECLKIINDIAKMNRSEPIIEVYEPSSVESSFQDLIHSNYLSTTIYINLLWFVNGLNFYSLVLLMTIMNGSPRKCLQDMSTLYVPPTGNTTDDSCCMKMNWEMYKNIYISTTGEIVYIFLISIFVDIIGRKKFISISIILFGIGSFLLNLCIPSLQFNILLLITRGATSGCYALVAAYTTEVFPTSVRALSLSIGNSCSRIGGICSPFLVNLVFVKYSFFVGTIILLIANVIAVVISFLLPYETMGRKLYQTADHETN